MACTNKFTPEANFTPSEGFTDYPPYLCPQTMFEPTYVTGYEDMALKVMDRMLISQYTNSPNLQEYMKAFVEEVNTLTDELHKVELARYIDNASDAHLDVIGVILQQTRNINIPKVWFGFQGASPVDGMADRASPLAGGMFRSATDEVFTVATPLNDIAYRKILLCRGYVLNQANFDVNTVYKAVETALGMIPASIKLYEDSERNWILELDAEEVTTEEVGLLRAIQHWFIPMIVNLNIRLTLIKRLVNGLPITDVLIYRTYDDYDGGTSIQEATGSWYDEELNTLTRGKSKSFPEVALIVMELGKITIYDATRTDLPMWMVFELGGSWVTTWEDSTFNMIINSPSLVTTYMLNGILYIGYSGNTGISIINFKEDWAFQNLPAATYLYNGNIAQRNDEKGYQIPDNRFESIIAYPVYDIVAISEGSGSIVYVATDNGLSRIAVDGTVSSWGNLGGTARVGYVTIVNDYVMWNTGDYYRSSNILFQPVNSPLVDSDKYNTNYWHFDGRYGATYNSGGVLPYTINDITTMWLNDSCEDALASDYALTKLYPNPSDWGSSMVANITKDFSSGIMHGDIRGAWLADTVAETVGVDETTTLVTNGGFDTDTNWEKETGWTIGGGVASCDGSQTTSTGIEQNIITTVGKHYKVSVNVTAVSGTVRLQAYFLNNAPHIDTSIPGIISFEGISISNNSIKVFAIGVDDTCTIDDVSVVETGNLIDNGDFPSDIDSWIDDSAGSGGVLSWNPAGQFDLTSDGVDRVAAYQIVPTIIGKIYTIATNIILGTINLSLGDSLGGTEHHTGSLPTGLFFLTFIASSTTTYIRFNHIGAATRTIDDITIRLADADRSYKNNALAIHGQITKTPVASGAELVWYGGFSEDNFLEQLHNPDLDFGTSDFYVIGKFNCSSFSTTQFLFETSSDGVTIGEGLALFIRHTTGELVFRIPGSNDAVTGQAVLNKDTDYAFIRISGIFYTFIDGVLVGSYDSTIKDMTNINCLTVGAHSNKASPATYTKQNLLRMGAGAISTTQIETIYNQESKMFEPNAKVTLQGSSSNVQAVDYDNYSGTIKACGLYHITTFKDLVVTEDEAAIATSVSTVNGATLTGGTTGAYFEA